MEKNFAKSFPPYKSVAIDLEITIPPAPENPWIKRARIKISILGEKTQPIDDKTKKNIEITNGRFLPNLSLTGPKNICPTANPIMLNVKLNCTREAVVSKQVTKLGNAGK